MTPSRLPLAGSLPRPRRFSGAGALLLGGALLSPPAVAQGVVHVVDDDGGPGVAFTDLPAAVLAAASGDTLLVEDGTYSGFTLESKGLTVLAEVGADVRIDGSITLRFLPPAESVLLRGLKSGVPQSAALVVEVCAGHVRVEDCVLVGHEGYNDPDPLVANPQGFAGARVVNSLDVAFARCELQGGDGATFYDWVDIAGTGGSGLVVSGGNVSFQDGECHGGEGGSDWGGLAASGGNGGRGALLLAGQLVATGASFTGGQGGSGGTDWTWGGCASGSPGGAGLEAAAGSFSSRDTTTTGGPGGFGAAYYGCHNGPPGADLLPGSATVTTYVGEGKGFVAPAPLRAFLPDQLVVTGSAGDVVLAAFSAPTAGFTSMPLLSGVLLTDTAPVAFALGTIPPGGTLLHPVLQTKVPGGLQSALFHGQTVHLDASGALVLGPYSAIVLLAPGF